jgi:hypothetical protein
MKLRLSHVSLLLMAGLLLAGCSGRVGTNIGQQCSEGLRLANKELEDAQAKGLGGHVNLIKAANLLAGASVQQQFEKFEGCVDKVNRARIYIQEAQK